MPNLKSAVKSANSYELYSFSAGPIIHIFIQANSKLKILAVQLDYSLAGFFHGAEPETLALLISAGSSKQ